MIGIRVEDETALEQRLDDVIQGVVHDAIAKGRATDVDTGWMLSIRPGGSARPIAATDRSEVTCGVKAATG